MSAMIPPDVIQDGVAYWKADKVSAYFGGSPTVGTLGVWRYRGEGPRFVKLGGKREHRQRDTRRVVYPVVFCQIFVGRFGVSFSPFERLFLGRFGFGQSCGLSVIA